MRKNGFTLIELLAVIVILAIIALIATPIILGIINDAREESNERSVELYASAVRNAIAAYQLTNPNAPTSFSELDIEHDGNVVCATEELYSDGSFYIADCEVNGTLVEYAYGEQQELPSTQVFKPQYYTWDLVGMVGETVANPSTEPPTGKNHYIGYDVDNENKVSAAYVCFVREGVEYCLKGYDTSVYDANIDIIKDAFAEIVDTDACSSYDEPYGSSYSCNSSGTFYASSEGEVFVDIDKFICDVSSSNGLFSCFNNDID